MSAFAVFGTVKATPGGKDWELIAETTDPVEATRTVHETEGTFWRRLLQLPTVLHRLLGSLFGHGPLERLRRVQPGRPALLRVRLARRLPLRLDGCSTELDQFIARFRHGGILDGHAASTTSARTAAAHSTSRRSYSRCPSGVSTPPDRCHRVRISSFTAAAERAEAGTAGVRGMPEFYGRGLTTASTASRARCQG